ncbi:putative transposase [Abditibacterium utsteinense]|uniref:Putative transposase n=1 Tax=Abditibacterium utsteinense TaxID=1960156 RepID=A0A2S8SNH0_9BACT|nr:IS3 family transposase [Abditibacterium utsteinense]PQV62376.1 putative transposase [Abditibacterium utsteinense]
MVTPSQKREAATHLQSVVLAGQEQPLSQRHACLVLDLCRQSVRRIKVKATKDFSLKNQIQTLSHQHPRYGYRRIHALLCRASASALNIKRVHRLWKQMARQVPPRKRRRTHLTNRVPRMPQQALYPGHVWSYDFVHDKCRGGAKLKLLCLSDEFTRQCHAIEVAASVTAKDVQKVLHRLFAQHGAPAFLRSDNGPEFVQNDLKQWLGEQHVQTLYIDPGSPWQNGKGESMHGKLRDECLDLELFNHRIEARCVIENYRLAFNSQRPHSSLGYQTPNEFAQSWKLNQTTLT